jgi:DNA-binding winged helix-turn-helix (wHTH) protein
VLTYLVRNRDRIVPKEELLDELWEERHVSESALTRVIRDLRKLLGDSSSEPRFIRTVYGKGFGFIGEIASEETAPRQCRAPPSPSSLSPTSRPSAIRGGSATAWPSACRESATRRDRVTVHPPVSSR